MTEVKFTKGPWVKGKYGQLSNPDGKSIGVWDCGIAIVYRDEESEANSRLIAAAPDMYEALELVAKSGAFSCFEDSMWDAVNDALAKARGEQ